MTQNVCYFDSCTNPVALKKMCRKHYNRIQRHGYNKPTFHDRTIKERILFRSVQQGDCLVWTGAVNHAGYGSISINSQTRMTHRISYEEHFGKIQDGLYVCHKCDNPPCVNPEHLFLGTQSDNLRDMVAKNRQNTSNRRRGEDHPKTKLSECDVLLMRELIDINTDRKALAWLFSVSKESVNSIATRRNWAHI